MEQKQKNSILGILALVFSVLGCTFLVGIILAIIDLCMKDGKKKTLSIIALVICGLWFVLALALGGSEPQTTDTAIATTEEATTEVATEVETEEQTEAQTEVATEEATTEEATEEMTIGQNNALASAKSYLAFSAFSHSGLIKQLEYEGYSTEDATFAADNCGADWNEQAAKSAQSYLDYTSFSRQGLIDQLLYEGFTAEQAEYGVTAVGY